MSRLEEYIKRYEDIHTGRAPVVYNGEKLYGDIKKKKVAFGGEQSAKYFPKFIQKISHIKKRSVSVLDYGCGRGLHMFMKEQYLDSKTTFEYHKGAIQAYYLYDPCVPEYNVKPSPGSMFDIALCCDVMEHIPEEDVDYVLSDVSSFIKQDGVALFSISGTPAVKTFEDGINLHVTIKPFDWWYQKLEQFVPQTFVIAYKSAEGKTRTRNSPFFTL